MMQLGLRNTGLGKIGIYQTPLMNSPANGQAEVVAHLGETIMQVASRRTCCGQRDSECFLDHGVNRRMPPSVVFGKRTRNARLSLDAGVSRLSLPVVFGKSARNAPSSD